MSLDIMRSVDGFEHANDSIDDVRHQLGVPAENADALNAGALSALDPPPVFSRSS